jgi:hypothetical protein
VEEEESPLEILCRSGFWLTRFTLTQTPRENTRGRTGQEGPKNGSYGICPISGGRDFRTVLGFSLTFTELWDSIAVGSQLEHLLRVCL